MEVVDGYIYGEIGDVYGDYTVLCIIPRDNRFRWKCQCTCGKTRSFYFRELLTNPQCRHGPHRKGSNWIDLTGRVFGELTVISNVSGAKWLCRCSCGKEKVIEAARLATWGTRSCGCRHPFKTAKPIAPGQQFGLWTVVERRGVGTNHRPRYLCRCTCGKERLVMGKNLRNGQTQSCGHPSAKGVARGPKIDDENKVYGDYRVLEWVTLPVGKGPHWICRCTCGVTRHFTHGELIKEPRCAHGANRKRKDYKEYLGRGFGKLTVLSYEGNHKWLCRCSCGKEKVLLIKNVLRGYTRSCGCLQGRPLKYVVGQRIGDWEIIAYLGRGKGYLLRCTCGLERVMAPCLIGAGKIYKDRCSEGRGHLTSFT